MGALPTDFFGAGRGTIDSDKKSDAKSSNDAPPLE